MALWALGLRILVKSWVVFLLGWIAWATLHGFVPDWDVMTFHLPASLEKWGLTTYDMGFFMHKIENGSPKLPHYIQGLLVYLTGSFESVGMIGLMGFLFWCLTYFLTFGHPSNAHQDEPDFLIQVVSMLAVPMMWFHFSSAYIDLITAFCLLGGLTSLFYLMKESERGRLAPPRASWMFVLGLGFAALSKYSAYSPIFVMLLAAFGFRVFRQLSVIQAFALIGMILYVPVSNEIKYGAFDFPWHEHGWIRNHEVPFQLLDKPAWYRFFYSLFELNRFEVSQYTYYWSLDQGVGYLSDHPHHRMGGWNGIWIGFLSVTTLLLAALKKFKLRECVVLLALIACAALSPQGHELRYFLVLPMAWVLVISFGLSRCRPFIKMGFLVTAAVFSGWALRGAGFERFELLKPFSESYPESAQKFWETAKGAPPDHVFKICEDIPNTIYYSGPDLKTYRVTRCD